jgi:hypothetical protein
VKEFARKTKLLESIDVANIAIGRDRYFPKAYVVDLPLESTPDHVWLDIFERRWKSSRHLWDRKLFVVGDKLRLVTSAENIEDKIDWVKQVIENTNRDVDEYNREAEDQEAQIKEDMRTKAMEEEKTSVDQIRYDLRKSFRTA